MTDLATRLKAATEGSRELSDEVLLALGFRYFPESDEWAPVNGWLIAICPTELASDPARSVDDGLALAGDDWFSILMQATQRQAELYGPPASLTRLPLFICAALVRAVEAGREAS